MHNQPRKIISHNYALLIEARRQLNKLKSSIVIFHDENIKCRQVLENAKLETADIYYVTGFENIKTPAKR